MTTGLVGLGERQLDDRLVDRGEPVEQELRVEADRDRLAVDARVDRLRAPAPRRRAGVEREPAVGRTRAGPRCCARRPATTRLTDSISVGALDPRGRQVLGGEQLAHPGELAVEQPGRRPPDAAATSPSKPMMPSPAPEADSAMVTSTPAVSDLAVSASTRAGTRAAPLDVGAARVPVELAQAEPEPVGGQQRDASALDLDPDAGQHRQHVVAAGGGDRLRDGVGERVAAARCRSPRASPAATGSPRPASSAGVNRAEPQVSDDPRRRRAPSSTGLAGRLRQMSASSRPETRALPSSGTWRGIVARAEVS